MFTDDKNDVHHCSWVDKSGCYPQKYAYKCIILLFQVYLDTTSYMLTSMDLLKDNQYVTYNLASLGVDIKFQMLNNDATYLAMVNFAYSTY